MNTSTDFKKFLPNANWINGHWITAESGASIEVTNPADGTIIGQVPNCGAAETGSAIDAARQAFEKYSHSDINTRVRLLRELHDGLMDQQEALARLLTAEQGKPLAEARGEIAIGAAYILWFAEEIRRTKGELIPSPTSDRRLMVTHHPVGVVAAITPWNFPSSMLARKLGPALAAGCTVVVKPASATPYSALAWGVLMEEVGFPPGVVNILTGSAAAIGSTIMSSPHVRKVTFTGSTAVGKQLIRQSADSVKKISMELGGNAPFLVFDDADLDAAVEGAMISKFRNMGQTCVCANRIYAQAGVHDAFVSKLSAAIEQLTLGPGSEPDVTQGPMIDMAAVEKVETLIGDALQQGGKVVVGGQRHKLGGTFFEPTLITGVTERMQFATEEIFGPVAPVLRFDHEEEVVAAANRTEYGLAAYIYTQDMARIFRLNESLDYGLMGFNTGLITTVEAPFGGLKESGIGKEGGSQGLVDYLATKYVCIAGLG